MTLSSETPTQDINAILNNGKDAFKRCDYEMALKHFSQALEMDPKNQMAYYFKKKIRFRLQQDPATNTQPT